MLTTKKVTPVKLGNQAVAQALLDEGVRFFAAYPGTPSTEITEEAEALKHHYQAIVHWSTNEAVALEEAIAAAIAGKYAAFAAKHVGLNVAADPLMTVAYMGIRGALVVNVSDDPSMHSSQNEQDTRWYGRLAHLPVLEPINPQNAYDLARKAVQLSHQFETPVIFRLTTRISHALAPIQAAPPKTPPDLEFEHNPQRFVCLPANSRKNKQRLNKLMENMKQWVETSDLFDVHEHGSTYGIIASSVAAAYALDVVQTLEHKPDVFIPYLTHPLPEQRILEFLKAHDKILIVEELDPVLEQDIKLIAYHNNLSLEIHGKNLVPKDGELNENKVKQAIHAFMGLPEPEKPLELSETQELLAPRPPTFCPGCPHRSTYFALERAFRKLDPIITNDIGCYSLGALAPFYDADIMLCMGASISTATALAASTDKQPIVAVIGDSTFWHTGISGLANAIWHNSNIIVLILDNDITAMTGMQPNPSAIVHPEHTQPLDIAKVTEAMGAKTWVIDPFQEKQLRRTIKEAANTPGVKVIVTKRPCAILEGQLERKQGKTLPPPVYVDHEACVLCGICYEDFACPAISFNVKEQKVMIDEALCTGCYYCVDICPKHALIPKQEQEER